MFDSGGGAGCAREGFATADLAAVAAGLRGMVPAAGEAENIDRIRLLEEVKAVCAAAQARETAALYTARRDAEAARGVPAAQRCRGVAGEVALARRDSPARGSRHVGLATALVHEMPHTMAALSAGTISEWRAVLVAKETAWLPVDGRRHVDEQLAARLAHSGDRALAAQARALAHAYDPAEAVRHLRRAENERRVAIRPAPEAMVYLSALVPMVQGVAAYAALDRAAASAATTGAAGAAGPRSRGQIMADTFVERLTGQHTAEAVPVEIHLVMTDTTLLATTNGRPMHPVPTDAAPATTDPTDTAPTDTAPTHTDPTDTVPTGGVPAADPRDAPAWVVGHGPIPAAAARDLLDPAHDDPTGRARVWVRRLYTDPDTGHLTATDPDAASSTGPCAA